MLASIATCAEIWTYCSLQPTFSGFCESSSLQVLTVQWYFQNTQLVDTSVILSVRGLKGCHSSAWHIAISTALRTTTTLRAVLQISCLTPLLKRYKQPVYRLSVSGCSQQHGHHARWIGLSPDYVAKPTISSRLLTPQCASLVYTQSDSMQRYFACCFAFHNFAADGSENCSSTNNSLLSTCPSSAKQSLYRRPVRATVLCCTATRSQKHRHLFARLLCCLLLTPCTIYSTLPIAPSTPLVLL